MAPHDDEDDPAVYRSGSSKNKGKGPQHNHTAKSPPPSSSTSEAHGNLDAINSEEHDNNNNNSINEEPAGTPSDPGEEQNDDDEDESTLLATQPGFNKLLLVLRDDRVMRFVKYVSAAAHGSRWDICGEYEVGIVEDGNDSE